ARGIPAVTRGDARAGTRRATRSTPTVPARLDTARAARLRLARDRLRFRRERERAAAGAEGLPGRRAGVRAPVRRPRAAEVHLGSAALLVRAAARVERDLPADGLQGRGDRVRRRRRRWLARVREHALPRARALLRGPAVGGPQRLAGRARAALR